MSVESFLASGPLAQHQVVIELTPASNRLKHPSEALEQAMDALWQEKVTAQPQIFDGAKFRLATSELAAGHLRLSWGLTSYKEYIGTCSRPDIVAQLHRDGGTLHLSRKVGVAAALVTADNKVVLLQRSSAVGAYPNMADVPGGHPEPSNIGLAFGSEYLPSDELNARCVAELFDSITAEVEEEVNVPRSALSPPLLLGVTLQGAAETPSYAFLLHCKLTAAQVAARYQDAKDQYESSHLIYLSADALNTEALKLTPSAAGCLGLLRVYLEQARM
ncbi:hypothetical protein ACHHYP_00694 [Achlya hypogyna]|uniref:Nudix hydrolase domain-containing protein n=1 Tax=Achlya hypogyna TaxID=1202772 RepID=A0A1V9ZUL7_ACHHY|nr:hypothetical protein ACHHYP_00694 [Achlya hypogyna]